MTKLTRPVRRVTDADSHPGWTARNRKLVVLITPPGLLSIGEFRRKNMPTETLTAVYDWMVWRQAERTRRLKLAAKKAKKGIK
jgi:hypothetical protein